MKLRILHTTFVVCGLLLAVACVQDNNPEVSEGYLEMTATANEELDCVFTKADDEADVIALTVTNSSDETVLSCDDITSVDWPVELSTGLYTTVATSGNDGGYAAFDSPFYTATEDFTIYRDKTTVLNMELTLASVLATVEFSDDFSTYFKSYVFTVSNGLGSLVYSEEAGTLDSEGYFSVTDTLEYTLALVNMDDQEYTISDSYSGVEAKQHYNFSFSIGSAPETPDGAGEITIVLDNSMNEEKHTYVIDLSVSDPVIDASSTYNPSSSLSFMVGDTDDKTTVISMEGNAASLILSTSNSTLISAGMPSETELVGASDETISALEAVGISTAALTTESTTAEIDFTDFFASLSSGTYTFSIYAENEDGGSLEITARVYVTNTVAATSANAWARFATLTGKWYTSSQPSGLGFQYRASGSSTWTDVTSTVTVTSSSKTFTTELRGLSSETKYEFRAISSDETDTPTISFTTEEEGEVFNMDFDTWVYVNDTYWSPNESTDNIIWDTANAGSASFNIIPTTREEEYLAVEGDGKYAAKLESDYAIITFAAGNIYTGQYQETKISLSNPGAILDWGIPFTCRPLALKGYYDYRPVEIDRTSSAYSSMKGEMDTGQIKIMLTTWDEPFEIDTQNSVFVDSDDDAIIAYAEMDLNETSEYTEFTLELEWRKTNVKPTYIVIVGAASKLGDYFTGGEGSTLYLDEFSFVYDPDELD